MTFETTHTTRTITYIALLVLLLLVSLHTYSSESTGNSKNTGTSENIRFSKDELRALQQQAQAIREQVEVPLDKLVGYDLEAAWKGNDNARADILKMSQQLNESITQETLSQVLTVPEATRNPNADATGVITLVSLSMPNIALEQLLAQSAQYQIPLVIRGVLPSGFKATILRINQLLTKGGKQPAMDSGIAINPEWFKQFNIQQVPAFISIKKGHCTQKSQCSRQDYDVVYGNISMEDALNILKKGDAKENAVAALARGDKQ